MQSFANICIGKLRNTQTCNLCETCELEILENTHTHKHSWYTVEFVKLDKLTS